MNKPVLLSRAVFLLVFSLSACSIPQANLPPTFTPSSIPATIVPTMASTPTLEPTVAPSNTPEPTLTATATPVFLWEDVTGSTIGATHEWTNKVELADINGDGLVDILFANGGDYDVPGDPDASRVFINQGPENKFKEVTAEIFGSTLMLARVIKVRDVNGDRNPDIMVGTTFQTQSRLYLGDGNGGFSDVTAANLPQEKASIGDLEFGDVDADGDLDVVLADWGAGSPLKNEGGRTRLWINNGKGYFSDVTSKQMPDILVEFSWELEFVDVDNDYDLDILISCKMCNGSFLFENTGKGIFKDVSKEKLPQYSNNYEFEAMDLNGDQYLDLVTINDGGITEHVFLNDRLGGFEDATPQLWPKSENPNVDDNMVAFLDYDSDGDADFLIGSLDGPDRLLINDGTGHLKARLAYVLSGWATRGTLGIALADLNNDGKLDVVQGQGEVAWPEMVYFGKGIPPDTAPPAITLVQKVEKAKASSPFEIKARVHDRKSPTMPHDWQSVALRWTADGKPQEKEMQWYGEYLWRAQIVPSSSGSVDYQVCATDRAGNKACSDLQTITVE